MTVDYLLNAFARPPKNPKLASTRLLDNKYTYLFSNAIPHKRAGDASFEAYQHSMKRIIDRFDRIICLFASDELWGQGIKAILFSLATREVEKRSKRWSSWRCCPARRDILHLLDHRDGMNLCLQTLRLSLIAF